MYIHVYTTRSGPFRFLRVKRRKNNLFEFSVKEPLICFYGIANYKMCIFVIVHNPYKYVISIGYQQSNEY